MKETQRIIQNRQGLAVAFPKQHVLVFDSASPEKTLLIPNPCCALLRPWDQPRRFAMW